jgi:transcription elongation factor Elf1
MAELKQQVDCSYCGSKNTVTVITKQSKYSRSIQVVKCTFCKKQNGIKEIFNRKPE